MSYYMVGVRKLNTAFTMLPYIWAWEMIQADTLMQDKKEEVTGLRQI